MFRTTLSSTRDSFTRGNFLRPRALILLAGQAYSFWHCCTLLVVVRVNPTAFPDSIISRTVSTDWMSAVTLWMPPGLSFCKNVSQKFSLAILLRLRLGDCERELL